VTPIILPDGREVIGWKAAALATGDSRPTMIARATWDNEIRAWRVREARHGRGARYDRLVAVAEAARAVFAAEDAWNAYIHEDGPDDDERAAVLTDMESEAKTALRAALDALKGGEARP
jgi:plasmid stability protein